MDKYPVPEARRRKAHVDARRYAQLYRQSVETPELFWEAQARELLEWYEPWKKTLQFDFSLGHVRWFQGGKINVSVNCLDRHLPVHHDKLALIWEGNEPGDVRRFTYEQLHELVCRAANVLKAHGVRRGDRVALYMPMVPELAAMMLACARVGAVHSVVFGGFSAEALRGRLEDSQSKVLVTSNVALRGQKIIPLKSIADEAIEGLGFLCSVLVLERTGDSVPMRSGRDYSLNEELAKASPDCLAEILDAEDPLFILYTSGSTGRPKGLLHTQAGYLLHTTFTHRTVFDIHDDDVYCCAADCGWITGHSYVVYGPLSNGTTTVMFESTPTYPDAGRYWDLIDRHKITVFYTAPTAIRTVAKDGDHLVSKYQLDSLRVLGSVGEPINKDAWLWCHTKVGRGRCPIVDTWWQTETGGIMISPLPGATELKPGSATLPFFGVQPEIVGEDGSALMGNEVRGHLCISFPWPGQARTIYGDHGRFIDTYFKAYPGRYFTGDAAIRDADGYYWILGRVDDVLNVAGHRLGTAEIESAIVQSDVVAEAAVVGYPHEIKGTGIYAYCVLRGGVAAGETTNTRIREAVKKQIGSLAQPDRIQCVSGLPKTRSGKIMRRILRKIAEGERDGFGDISTLADPLIVDEISRGAGLV